MVLRLYPRAYTNHRTEAVLFQQKKILEPCEATSI